MNLKSSLNHKIYYLKFCARNIKKNISSNFTFESIELLKRFIENLQNSL